MDASKLAAKVRRVLEKQIRAKGYEVDAKILTPAMLNPKRLSIADTGPGPSENETPIRIVVTSNERKESSTDIGQNTEETLNFIAIEDGTEADVTKVIEGRILLYSEKRYLVLMVSPSTLAGQLIIKEVSAKAVK